MFFLFGRTFFLTLFLLSLSFVLFLSCLSYSLFPSSSFFLTLSSSSSFIARLAKPLRLHYSYAMINESRFGMECWNVTRDKFHPHTTLQSNGKKSLPKLKLFSIFFHSLLLNPYHQNFLCVTMTTLKFFHVSHYQEFDVKWIQKTFKKIWGKNTLKKIWGKNTLKKIWGKKFVLSEYKINN